MCCVLGRLPMGPIDPEIGAVVDFEMVRAWLDSSAVVGDGALPC